MHLALKGVRDDLDSMRRSRDWYRHRYHLLIAVLKENHIRLPWSADEAPEEDVSRVVEISTPTKLETTKQIVIADLNLNSDRAPSAHRYAFATKAFAFAADVFSGACYRLIREILDLPSERILRDFAAEVIPQFEAALTDPDGAHWLISRYFESFPAELAASVSCTLWN